jgi:DNA primase
MGISKQSIEDLKNKSKISDFILSSTTGKLRGNKGMALCPFHGEKTASMSFTDEENLFHCFGCREGGDIFKYIQLINNVEFQESVEIAADKYSFNLTYTDSKFESDQKNLISYMNKLNDYFVKNMNEGKSQDSINYLKSRNLEGVDIKEFKIGFAEKNESDTLKFINTLGISKNELRNLGLLSDKGNLLFKNRIIFPITNLRNDTIGFGGRAIEDYGPKYINSAESGVYKKNRALYFTDNFLSVVKKKKFVILVEGYFDVIAFNKLGYANVASPSGTALTVQQINLLSRYTKDIYICFDNDTAGDMATKRILEIKNNQPSDLNFFKLNLPDNYKDISEFFEDGKKNIKNIFDQKEELVEFCINMIIDTNDTKKTFQEFKNITKFLSPLEKDLAISYLSKKIGITKEVISNELNYQSNNESDDTPQFKKSDVNHIITFQEILIADLIKSKFEYDDEIEYLINIDENFKKLILDIKSNKNPEENEKYQNISYTDGQLIEAISRLYIYFANNKIESLIKEMDESNDLSILEDLEYLKKKIEFYQNTL